MDPYRTALRQAALMHLVKMARQGQSQKQPGSVNKRTWTDLLLESVPAAGAGGAAGYFSGGAHKSIADLANKLVTKYQNTSLDRINKLVEKLEQSSTLRGTGDIARTALQEALNDRIAKLMKPVNFMRSSPYARYGTMGALGLGAGLGTLGLLQLLRSQLPRPFGTLSKVE